MRYRSIMDGLTSRVGVRETWNEVCVVQDLALLALALVDPDSLTVL